MRILYHFRTQGTGAEGIHIAGMARAFEELGYTVTFSSPTGNDPRETAGASPFAQGASRTLLSRLAAGLPAILFECMEIAYNHVAYRRNRAVLGQGKFDFIYERHAFFLSSTAKLAKERGIPLVVEVNEFAGDERVRATPRLHTLARRADLITFQAARLIVVVSPHLQRRIADLGIDSGKVLVMPNAVGEHFFAAPSQRTHVRSRLGLDESLIIGFVGWFVAWHRLDRLIEVFASISGAHHSARLLLVGDGPLKSALLSQAKSLGVGERVVLVGPVPHADIHGWLDAMDVAVVPHANEYRSPIKLFEAMARGKAVLAPRTEPIASVVQDGTTGMLFSTNDEADLAGKLGVMVEDTALRERLGAAARMDVENNHTWRMNAQKVLDALQS